MAEQAALNAARKGGTVILLTLAAGQFLMILDSSVMNVSIATVAQDVGTNITGIQGAITAYTLVMAALMLTGAKVGSIIGRKRAFSIGLVIYASGSLTTALAPSLPVLLVGWSFLEGVGASLILPAIVALVASNFPPERRAAAYGLVAAAGAIAVALGPLIGGIATTYFSWRWVFAGEVLLAAAILLFARRTHEERPEPGHHVDVVSSVLSAVGLTLIVFAVLRSGVWGWIKPKADAPDWLGVSAVTWLILAGVFTLWLFLRWQDRCERVGRETLIDPALFRNLNLRAGLLMFFFQFFIQAGFFFLVPIYLSVALGLSAIDTGLKIMPLSLTLLIAALGVPRLFPRTSPRLIVRVGLFALLAGTLILLGALSPSADASIVLVPMLLVGLGIGILASQLGSVTVSAAPDEKSPEVGGLQNTVSNLGISLGTALAGAILISTLTSSFLTSIEQNSAIPKRVTENAQVKLSSGVPFVSDKDLDAALKQAHVPPRQAKAATSAYETARIDGLKSALAIVALVTLIALFAAQRLPTDQPGAARAP